MFSSLMIAFTAIALVYHYLDLWHMNFWVWMPVFLIVWGWNFLLAQAGEKNREIRGTFRLARQAAVAVILTYGVLTLAGKICAFLVWAAAIPVILYGVREAARPSKKDREGNVLTGLAAMLTAVAAVIGYMVPFSEITAADFETIVMWVSFGCGGVGAVCYVILSILDDCLTEEDDDEMDFLFEGADDELTEEEWETIFPKYRSSHGQAPKGGSGKRKGKKPRARARVRSARRREKDERQQEEPFG